MCGISGIVDPRGARQSDLRAMNEAVRHRGPDGSGVHVQGEFGLGHTRLSIIDLSGGAQPMSNTDGSLWITFNGEIYNYRELRKSLEGKYEFRTHSDTEVILHLYQEKGESCLHELRGMFAFGIYDTSKERLFLARDHLGQKPLYYADVDGRFLFASEIKALLTVAPELRELSAEALHEYLTLRIITPPRSMFRRIKKLPPGHYLVYQKRSVTERRYWDLRYEPKHTQSLESTLDELDARVRETVQYHLVSDVPVGAFLSGGMDSSLVVAIMSILSGQSFKTFAGDVPYENYSELPYAKRVAEKYGTNAYELTIRPSLVRLLPQLLWHLDEPSDPLSTCMFYISELARKHVKVVLGGDGGDELFGGYDRYFGNIYVSYYALIPEVLRKQVFARLLKLFPEGYWYRSVGHKLKWMHELSFFSNGDRYARSLSYFYFSDRYRRQLYTDKMQQAAGVFDAEANLCNYFDSDNATELVDKMLYTDSMTRMPDHPIMVLDRMTMAHGLEARSPFLDHKLAEFCAKVPPIFKVKGNRLRYLQTQLAKRYLPEELIRRKKQGFSSPLPYILADEFKLLYKSMLEASHLVDSGYLRESAIQCLLRSHLDGRSDHGQRLWQLCNAEIWYRMYIENEDKNSLGAMIDRAGGGLYQKSAAA